MIYIDPETSCHRQQQGSDYHQSSSAFQEHTHYQKDHVAQHEEYILVAGKIQHSGGNNLGEIDPSHVLAEHTGGDHYQHDTGSAGDGVQNNGNKVFL